MSPRIIAAVTILLLAATTSATAESAPWSDGFSPPPSDDTWIRLKSGEWIKGELEALYDERLMFFNTISIKIKNVRELHGRTDVEITLRDRSVVTGNLQIRGEQVTVTIDDNRANVTDGTEMPALGSTYGTEIQKSRNSHWRRVLSAGRLYLASTWTIWAIQTIRMAKELLTVIAPICHSTGLQDVASSGGLLQYSIIATNFRTLLNRPLSTQEPAIGWSQHRASIGNCKPVSVVTTLRMSLLHRASQMAIGRQSLRSAAISKLN
jgi:hypothetical protein